MILEFPIVLLFPALMVFAGAMDIFTMTIPNRIPVALTVGFFCIAPFAGLGWETIAIHVGLSIAMVAIGVGMFAAGWMGGGDAKLLAAASLWMGLQHFYDYAMSAALCGGAVTILMLFLRTFPLPAGLAKHQWIMRLHDAGRGVPYGFALAAAGLLVYPYMDWIQTLH